jgi:hypothetical protein
MPSSQNPKSLQCILLVVLTAYPSMSLAAEDGSISRCEQSPRDYCRALLLKAEGDVKKDVAACETYMRRCENLALKRATPAAPPARPEMQTPTPSEAGSPANSAQRVFIRADKLENLYPGLTQTVSAGQALGASFSYTANDFVQTNVSTKSGSVVNVSSSQATVINGLASYAFTPDNQPNFLGYTVGSVGDTQVMSIPSLWVSANGNWDHPTKAFGDTSALKIGPEADFEFISMHPGEQFFSYLGIAPFYQTDFYGKAQAAGATLSWSPSYRPFFLNASNLDNPSIVDGFVVLRPEATYLNVEQVGQTNLNKGSYEWFGGAARGYVFFFPSGGPIKWSPYIADRLSFIGTVQYYWDANSNATVHMYSAALQYKFACTQGEIASASDPAKKVPCTGGSPSVAIQYDWGTDRDTLQETKKIMAKLNYAF